MSLEMALVTPVLLLLILGIATLGHAFMVRFMLSSAAYDAARTCALARQTTTTCAKAQVDQKLGATAKWCVSGTQVTTRDTVEQAFTSVSAFEVRVRCRYGGGVGLGYLALNQLVITDLNARAVMPH